MSEEEKEAIEYLKKRLSLLKHNYQFATEQAIEILINALEKKDKIIDLMAEMLRYYNGMKQEQCFCIDICKNKNCDENNCFYRIKEYFIKLVEDK